MQLVLVIATAMARKWLSYCMPGHCVDWPQQTPIGRLHKQYARHKRGQSVLIARAAHTRRLRSASHRRKYDLGFRLQLVLAIAQQCTWCDVCKCDH